MKCKWSRNSSRFLPRMNVVEFIGEGANDDLRSVAFRIEARHESLKDQLIFVVVAAERLHEAPQTALHRHGQGGIL